VKESEREESCKVLLKITLLCNFERDEGEK
jgi:hypothetical protein